MPDDGRTYEFTTQPEGFGLGFSTADKPPSLWLIEHGHKSRRVGTVVNKLDGWDLLRAVARMVGVEMPDGD